MHERWRLNHETTAIALFNKRLWDGFTKGSHFNNHFTHDSADTRKRFKGIDWPSEKSYFALDLSLTVAKEIGAHVNQDAII